MYKPREKIVWFAIISRVVILILQFVFNSICPDHNADAFKSPTDMLEQNSLYDNLIKFMLNGLSRWDGEYFLHIAKYGYTYENTLAFYPLYPLLIRIISVPIRSILFVLNIHSSVLIAAALINTVCFVKSAVIFYDLSIAVLKRTSIAYKAAILYCINPASIFFSAVYSESFFAYLTFYSMLRSMKLDPYVAFPIGLSILTRSNGAVNIGFPIYFALKNLFHNYATKNPSLQLKLLCRYTFKMPTLKSIFLICNTIIILIIPFILLQMYNYVIFCIPNTSQTALPKHIVNYSIANNLVLPGTDSIEWCQLKIPVAYSHIQRKYWNVGFLNYYALKQIPNFILALPILYTMLKCIKECILECKNYFCESSKKFLRKKYPPEMFVFAIHGLFLTTFCILFVHIQVSTRLLCSASPLMYWYCALTMTSTHNDSDNDIYESQENMVSKWKVFFFTQKRYTSNEKLILSYFLGYAVIGCFMFSNFLPWT